MRNILKGLLLCTIAGCLPFQSHSALANSTEGVLLSGVSVLPSSIFPRSAVPAKLAPNRQTLQWLPIPDWLAGRWHATSQVLIYSYSYKQHDFVLDEPMQISIDRTSTIGTQRDNASGIWHYAGTPYYRTVKTQQYIENQQIQEVSLLEGTSTSVILKTNAMVSHCDLRTGDVFDVFNEQTFTKYEPLDRDRIQVSFFVTDYELTGNPRNASRSLCIEKRARQFQNIDSDERGDLKRSFQDFLRSSGRRQ